MSEAWVALLIAGSLLLIGFLASLTFDRFRIPDFLILIVLGIILGHLPISPFGSSMVDSLEPVLPTFTVLTLAFILFEGGLTFRLGVGRLELGVLLGHIVGAMALTMIVVWYMGVHLLGLDQLTAIVMGAAFAGPSATIAVSFATRLKMRERASGTIVLEGALTNVIAVVIVVFLLKHEGAITANLALPYAIQCTIAALGAFGMGVAWRFGSQRLASHKFVAMATVAWAIVVYSIFEGFVGNNGAVAAFVFGVAVGYRWPTERSDARVKNHDGMLKGFQSEVAFALRTFFFIYLGLLITLDTITMNIVLAAALISIGLLAARIPTSLILSHVFAMSAGETRAIIANVARGMTDVILILLAVQSGLLPATDTSQIIATLTIVVLISAAISAVLLFSAQREESRYALHSSDA